MVYWSPNADGVVVDYCGACIQYMHPRMAQRKGWLSCKPSWKKGNGNTSQSRHSIVGMVEVPSCALGSVDVEDRTWLRYRIRDRSSRDKVRGVPVPGT